jgi:hypothetical protein
MRRLLLILLLLACTKPSKPSSVEVKDAGAGVDHGKFESSISNLRSQLATAPCDKRLAVQLGEYLERANDYAGAGAVVDEWEKKCPPYTRLLWVRQASCERLERWDCAAKTATALIESDPTDSDFWWWRGQAEGNRGHYHKARGDYLQSMANKPTGFPAYRLAQFADTKLKAPCDGALLIQWWITHGRRTDEDWIDPTRTKLFTAGACDKNAGHGKTTIAATANAPIIRTKVKLDGTAVELVVDEHAGTTAVSKALADKAKLEVSEQSVDVLAAGTLYEGHLAHVKKLELGGASVADTDVAVIDGLPNSVDGVLGLNVLMQFDVKRTAKGYELAALH